MTRKARNEVPDPARLIPPLRIKRRKWKNDLLYFRWPNPEGGPGKQRCSGSLNGTGVRRRECIEQAFAKFRLDYTAAASTCVSQLAEGGQDSRGIISELIALYRSYLAQTKGTDWCSTSGRGNRMHYSLEALGQFAGDTEAESFTPTSFLHFALHSSTRSAQMGPRPNAAKSVSPACLRLGASSTGASNTGTCPRVVCSRPK